MKSNGNNDGDQTLQNITQKERDKLSACAVVWAFGYVLEIMEDWKHQKMSWQHVSNRVKAARDMYAASFKDVQPYRPQRVAEFIPSMDMFYTDNGYKTRLDKCDAILHDKQHAQWHGAIRLAKQMIVEKKALPADLENKITSLYRICRG